MFWMRFITKPRCLRATSRIELFCMCCSMTICLVGSCQYVHALSFLSNCQCGGKLAHLIKEKNEEVQKVLDQLKSSSKNGIDKKIQALYEHQHDQNTVSLSQNEWTLQVPKYIRINTYITEDSAVLKQLESIE